MNKEKYLEKCKMLVRLYTKSVQQGLDVKELRRTMRKIAIDDMLYYRIRDELEEKANRFSYIYKNSEDGYVVPITEGCDCDGVQYRNVGKPQKAVPLVLEKNEDEAYEWADGTMDIYYVKPSVALKMENKSVDRVAEAYEDGHPHSITLSAI
tara:strand:+ start:96 stop:551 length:456 start_codon:yes stop_codon:yes gene_type:complete